MPEAPRENPFRHMGKYYWTDENGQTHGPFDHQKTALFNLLKHAYPDFKPEPVSAGIWHAALFELPLAVLFIIFCYWLFGK